MIFYAKDYWIDHYSSPKVDDTQDWTLIYGQRNGTYLNFEFQRPYKTCDALEDLEFNTNYLSQNIIWAYGEDVPQSYRKIYKHIESGVQEVIN